MAKTPHSRDRLYGELKFPELISELMSCPGIMRLREVRMANVPFVEFPSFSAVTRHEHSLGVCHLAGLCADEIGLSPTDKHELMIAALYHDVGTPPFAHAVEEVLKLRFGFDHEQNLHDLIAGKASGLGGQQTQVFLGRRLLLHSVLQGARARKLGLDPYRIADIATGGSQNWLSTLVCSRGVDLDNIDNVVRACTAMGFRSWDERLSLRLAKSFVPHEGAVALDASEMDSFGQWQRARRTLYDAIYTDVLDFSMQTMLKTAVHALVDSEGDSTVGAMSPEDWKLTDQELVQERFMQHPVAKGIVVRMRLGRPYAALAVLYVAGSGATSALVERLEAIEEIGADVFQPKKSDGSPRGPRRPEVVANYFPDKRHRVLRKQFAFLGAELEMHSPASDSEGAILGVFTPQSMRATVQQRATFAESIEAILPGGLRVRPFHSDGLAAD